MRSIAALFIAAVMLTACGSPAPVTADAALDVHVDLGDGRQRQGILTCAGGTAKGTGHLESNARAACAAVLEESNRKFLTEDPPKDQVCTQVYGGPQKATVTGRIRGRPVQATITRTNGCSIAQWDALVALLGRPE